MNLGALNQNKLSSGFEDYAAARNSSREAFSSPCISHGNRQFGERLMQGALHAVIWQEICQKLPKMSVKSLLTYYQ
jgi:hypothetical protein